MKEEELRKLIAAKFLGRTIAVGDELHLETYLGDNEVDLVSRLKGDPIHFDVTGDLQILLDEDGSPYYQLTLDEVA